MITITPTVSFHVWRKGHTYQVEDTPDIRNAITKGRLRQMDSPAAPPPPARASDPQPVPDDAAVAHTDVDTGDDAAPSAARLMRHTRGELVDMAESLDVWVPDDATKAHLVAAIIEAT